MQELNSNGRVAQTNGDDELRIPLDLRDWIDTEEIKAWVAEEVDTLDWKNPELLKYLEAHPDFRPKALLSLLIFAYATSVIESEEIVASLRRQDGLNDFWRGPGPTAKEIGKFRKENRALLKWGIVQVLKRALQQKFQFGDSRFPPGLRQAAVESAVARLDLARHMDRAAQGA